MNMSILAGRFFTCDLVLAQFHCGRKKRVRCDGPSMEREIRPGPYEPEIPFVVLGCCVGPGLAHVQVDSRSSWLLELIRIW
jgi:hypothetical protein